MHTNQKDKTMSGTMYFWVSLALLVGGYFVYGVFVEKIFGIQPDRPTPVKVRQDGVDYLEMPRYKIFLIQLLNIAGLGPVLGPILGALYGPIALLWVVFGCIFAGAVHDFCSGMMSLRYGGASYPEVIGRNLGTAVRKFMEGFAVIFLILVGAVFVLGPAKLLVAMTGIPLWVWSVLIFAYYFAATVLPISTIIGRVYPFFAVLLLIMAVGLMGAMFVNGYPVLPNMDFMTNVHPSKLPIWPLIFITIACGAISGFHATQSPMMARCMTSDKQGRPIFYGSMIAEGILGLIWVTLGLSFYESPEALGAVIKEGTPTLVVQQISMTLLGPIGGFLAVLGVVVLPITTGDTAFRSARLLVADALKMEQKEPAKRLYVAVPLFAVGIALTFVDFDVIWRYFGWANQTMACVTLWAIAVYLGRRDKLHWIASIPATFMTVVTITYLCNARIGFNLPMTISTVVGVVAALAALALFLSKRAGSMSRALSDEASF